MGGRRGEREGEKRERREGEERKGEKREERVGGEREERGREISEDIRGILMAYDNTLPQEMRRDLLADKCQ